MRFANNPDSNGIYIYPSVLHLPMMNAIHSKSVLTFQSDFFDMSWEWRAADAPMAPPPGQPVAAYLAARLAEKGIKVLFVTSEAVDSQWMFSVSHNGIKYNMLVGWWLDSVGRWVVQIRKRVGFAGALLGLFGRCRVEDVEPIRRLVDEVVAGDSRFSDVRWLSLQELDEIYWPKE